MFMSAEFLNSQPQPQTRKGLAIASLVLGIISIPTLGLLVVGAITAIVLGAIALGRIKREPATYGGKGMAIAGIITSAVSIPLIIPIFGILAAVAVPQLTKELQTGRETAAIQTLRIVHNSQAQFQAAKQRFGTLKELTEAGYLDSKYASGAPVSGYIYTSAGETTEEKYCVQATRQSSSTASRDFNVIEDGAIRFVESKEPSPIPHGKGAPLASAGSSAGPQ
jgi:type II secretory pathway pseudopilin PulG